MSVCRRGNVIRAQDVLDEVVALTSGPNEYMAGLVDGASRVLRSDLGGSQAGLMTANCCCTQLDELQLTMSTSSQ